MHFCVCDEKLSPPRHFELCALCHYRAVAAVAMFHCAVRELRGSTCNALAERAACQLHRPRDMSCAPRLHQRRRHCAKGVTHALVPRARARFRRLRRAGHPWQADCAACRPCRAHPVEAGPCSTLCAPLCASDLCNRARCPCCGMTGMEPRFRCHFPVLLSMRCSRAWCRYASRFLWAACPAALMHRLQDAVRVFQLHMIQVRPVVQSAEALALTLALGACAGVAGPFRPAGIQRCGGGHHPARATRAHDRCCAVVQRGRAARARSCLPMVRAGALDACIPAR